MQVFEKVFYLGIWAKASDVTIIQRVKKMLHNIFLTLINLLGEVWEGWELWELWEEWEICNGCNGCYFC